MRTYTLLLLVFVWLGAASCGDQPNTLNEEPGIAVAGTANTAESPATGTAGVVSSAHPRATQAGLDVLEEGFPISPRLAGSIAGAFDEFSDYARSFYGRDGRPLAAGDMLVQQDLAGTFRAMVEQGGRAIHGGSVGQAIDAAMQAAGSFLALEDLADNEAEWYDLVRIPYRGYEVLTASPPSTAFPALIRLGLMSRFDVPALGHNSAAFLHRFAEATKHAFWCRLAYCTFEPKGNPMDAHAGHHKLSGDVPTIVLHAGRPWAALGTPGGHTIGQTVPQMVLRKLDSQTIVQSFCTRNDFVHAFPQAIWPP